MKSKRLLWQVYPLYLLVILLSLLVVTVYATGTVKDSYLEQTASHLESMALLLSDQVLPLPAAERSAALNARLTQMGKKAAVRITVILPDGKVLCDSEENPLRMDDHKDRPEIQEALAGRTGVSTRASFTLKKNMMYVAVPLHEESRIVGVARTSIPVDAVDDALRTLYLQMGLAGLAVAFLAGWISLFLSRRISRPIEEMKTGAVRFAEGDLSHRLAEYDSLEMGSLARAMNKMAERLDERIRTVISQRREQEAILSSMVEGVLAVDGEERVLHMNDAVSLMIGVPRSEAQGRTIQEVVRNTALQRFITEVREHREPMERDVVMGENRDRFVQVHGTLLHGAEDQTIGVLIVLNDVTRLRKLENIRQDFVANVSHELKTPITSIKGFVETLQEGAMDRPEDARRFLGIVARHTDRLNAIIEDLLSLSRIESASEKEKMPLEMYGVKEVVLLAKRACEPLATAQGITIDTQCPPGLKAPMNAQLMEQALVNLLNNAVKYSNRDSRIEVQVEECDGGVEFRIRDEGCGIAEEHLPRLFERFYRVDKARSRSQGGTGLGLSIVKHIVQAHKGRVSVTSQVDEGSVFSIFIPLS